jgi:hypothetical protein
MDPAEHARLMEIRKQIEKLEGEERNLINGRQTKFKDGLIFAANARCKECNSGLCYVERQEFETGSWLEESKGSWICLETYLASVAKRADFVFKEHQSLPFVFWSISSEIQPSSTGNTTRPKSGPHSLAEATR